jgi:hypothetical protein
MNLDLEGGLGLGGSYQDFPAAGAFRRRIEDCDLPRAEPRPFPLPAPQSRSDFDFR